MNKIGMLEECFRKYVSQLDSFGTEGIITVNMDLLKELNISNALQMAHEYELNYAFHVHESDEKITLWNNEFVVWIVPESQDGHFSTYVLIALNKQEKPQLELVFVASNVFNSSQLILRILEKFLGEIEENEGLLRKL